MKELSTSMKSLSLVLKRVVIVVMAVGLARCGSDGVNPVGSTNDVPVGADGGSVATATPTDPAPTPDASPTSTPTDDPKPGPGPTRTATPPPPTPTPAPDAPEVTINVSRTSCHPTKNPNTGAVTGCPVTFTAVT